ncbi:cupin domain-containing protein [Jiella pacifica]|uniref:Allophanate hydrolase n=1 Tax=Jiella pacifica TaxID=2696469 RepID=A0A6N9TC01_9HYPH|nr:cupin domain-containing protein [Jiella pacifica]NDW07596.1 allophanate hydrolase [Jiella pacifica]
MPAVFSSFLELDLAAVTFEPFRDGVEIARLSGQGDKGETALLRYAPGASVPMHEHTGLETILVLSGSQSDDDGTYRAGDLVLNQPGSRHRVWSAEGCLVLISWAAPVRILGDG